MTSSFVTAPQGPLQQITIDNPWAVCQVSLFGGHVMSFIPKSDGRERLWMSPKAKLDGSKALRGGIPVCWPWFGDHSSDSTKPAHGYARNSLWQLLSAEDIAQATRLTLTLIDGDNDHKIQGLALTLVIEVGRTLTLRLISHNQSERPISITAALHSYFKVDDIAQAELKGLSGDYLDKTQGYQKAQTPDSYRFTQETDRVHLQAPKKLTIEHGDKATEVHSQGHNSIVVWNPWAEKSQSMGDMSDDGYRHMLCVETAVAAEPIEIAPGEPHQLTQIVG